LPDALEIRFFLWIGAEVVLHLGTDLIFGPILQAGKSRSHQDE
jgi:hypothetical protein